MSWLDWVVLVAMCLAGLGLIALAAVWAWWIGSTLSEIREVDRQVRAELLRRRRERQ